MQNRGFFYSLILLAALAVCSCQSKNKSLKGDEALNAMKSYEGTWQLQPNLQSFQHWESINNGFIGRDFTISDSDTIISTVYFLEPSGDSIRLQVQPIDFSREAKNATINYKLTHATESKFVFESPNHNFPNKMTYLFQRNNKEIALLLEGNLNGQQQQADLLYKKITQ